MASDELSDSITIALAELMDEEIQTLIDLAAEEFISGDVEGALSLKLAVDFDSAHKEALVFLKDYKAQLIEKGGSTCTVPILDEAGNITGWKQEFIPWLKDYHANQRKQLADAVRDMIKEGKSVEKAAKEIDDIFTKYKGHAEATIQGESRKANTAGSLNRYEKAGLGEWEWSTAGSNVCPYCQALAGQRFKIGESEQPYPPLHNRCRCRANPVIDLEADAQAMGG